MAESDSIGDSHGFVRKLAAGDPDCWTVFRRMLIGPIRELISLGEVLNVTEENIQSLANESITWFSSYLPSKARDARWWARVEQSTKPLSVLWFTCLSSILRLYLWEPSAAKASPAAWQVCDEVLRQNEADQLGLCDLSDVLLRYEVFLKPRDSVGGDFLLTHDPNDGTFWVMVGDTQGKSWRAWILKRCVFTLWERTWLQKPTSPIGFLVELDRMLVDADCLPEGFFVEATLGVLKRDGSVRLVSAGAGYVVHSTERPETVRFECLDGTLLGRSADFESGDDLYSEHTFWLDTVGSSVSWMTDGVPEQPSRHGTMARDLALLKSVDIRNLHLWLTEKWAEAVAASREQRDDTTIVTFTRVDRESSV